MTLEKIRSNLELEKTEVRDIETDETLGNLVEEGERLLVAEGGVGGEGNGAVWRRTRRDSKARLF